MIKLDSSSFPRAVRAIPSKSELHRILFSAAFAEYRTRTECSLLSDDIAATVDCLNTLGAEISFADGMLNVTPVKKPNENGVYYCRESGATLRFLLPVLSAIGADAELVLSPALSKRPIADLEDALTSAGAHISRADDSVFLSGKADLNGIRVKGDVSSQYVSGLMLASGITGGEICIDGRCESRPYIEMTAEVMRRFGHEVITDDNRIEIKKSAFHVRGGIIKATGDWSDASVFLTAGAVGRHPVSVSGLDINSVQGDRIIADVIVYAGGRMTVNGDTVTAYPSVLRPFTVDVSDTPDLAPALAVLAANAEGASVLTGTRRLKYKESDRAGGIALMLASLGGKAELGENEIKIYGGGLSGGEVPAFGDHRMIMAAAAASAGCKNEVIIKGEEAVEKSHPGFFEEFSAV